MKKQQHKIGVYIRVSTDKQVLVFEGSLDTQKYRMQEFVKNKNKELGGWGDITEFYIEESISAGTDRRPEYQRMMSDVRRGHINLILVADISRLSRNTYDFGVLLKELEKHGAKYLSLKEQFETSTPSGRLMMNMVVNMAQFEREQTAERVSINCHSRALRGFANGGHEILGYDKHKDRKGSYIVNEVEASDVRRIFQLYKEYGSIRKLVPILNSMGILPKKTNKSESGISHGLWNYDSLKTVLSNYAYVGKKEVNKKNKRKNQSDLKPWEMYSVVKASWPGILDNETFESVQIAIEENRLRERDRLDSGEKRPFVLTGILRCGECGNPLCGQSSHGALNVHRYYAHSKGREGKLTCATKRIKAEEIEQAVVSYLEKVAVDGGYLTNLKSAAEQSHGNTQERLHKEIEAVEVSLQTTAREIEQVFKLQMQLDLGSLSMGLAKERLEELGKQKKRLENLRTKLLDQISSEVLSEDPLEELNSRILDFKRGWKKATTAEQKRLLRRVFGALVYKENVIEVQYYPAVFGSNDSSGCNRLKLLKKSIDEEGAEGDLEGSDSVTKLQVQNLRVEGNGDATSIRTKDLRLRRALLYPAELWHRFK